MAVAAASPAYAQFGDLLRQLPTGIPGLPGGNTQAPPPATIPAGVQTIEPRGYSQQFQPVRTMIVEGRYADAMVCFTPVQDPPPAATPEPATDRKSKGRASHPAPPPPPPPTPPGSIISDPYLARVELGLIAFESGDLETAITYLRQAEEAQNARRDATGMTAAGNKIGDAASYVFGTISGQKGIGRYNPLDHERVLQLNYMALAYLLQGDRRSYNITRRCIAEQGELKTKFDRQLTESQSKYAQQTGDPSKVTEGDRQSFDGLAGVFRAYGAQANRVSSAYVNPLGDYLAGVIQEIASREQAALRDNSRIAYQNAVKLCGRSPQLSAAAAAMARPRPPTNERVLHVIAGEGFSPQREVLTYGLNIRDQVVPVRVPVFKPVGSPVQRIAVLGAKGAPLANLDPIGDFEAIRMRDQQDRVPLIMLDIFASTLASYFTGQATKNMGVLGGFLRQVRENNASPDTRSWLSLPGRFHAARLVLPANTRSVQLASFDAGGRRLNTETVPVSPTEAQSIIYARVTPGAMRVQTARRLWIEGRLEEDKA